MDSVYHVTLLKLLLMYLVLINLVTFILFAVDKRRAFQKKYRVRERTLLLCAVFGGALGGLVVMLAFQHKTRKKRFALGLPFLLIVQALLIVYHFVGFPGLQ